LIDRQVGIASESRNVMQLKFYPALLILLGLVTGAGFGYLQASRTPERFRSTATFRVTGSSGLNGGESTGPSGVGKLGRAGDLFRSREVVSKAVADGGLAGLRGLGTGQTGNAVEEILNSGALNVEVLGFSLTEIMVQASFDALDPSTAQQVMQALLESYQALHFLTDIDTSLADQRAKWKQADAVLAELEAAEAEHSRWLLDNADYLSDSRTPEELRMEVQEMKDLQARLKTRVADLQQRLNDASAARQAGESTAQILFRLRGNQVDLAEPDAPADEAELLALVRQRIVELRQQILSTTDELQGLEQRITELTELARERIRSSVRRQEQEERLAQLRKNYDEAVQRLRRPPGADEAEGEVQTQLAILRTPGPGVAEGQTMNEQIVWGALWGGGGALAFCILAAGFLAMQRPRIPTY